MNNNLPSLPDSKDVIREASKLLKVVEHQREIEDKFFQKYEEHNEYLSKFEEKLSNSFYYDRLKSSNINEKFFSKIYSLLEDFSKLDPNQISKISKLLVNKSTASTQTDTTDESVLINKISIVEKSNEKLSKECNKYKNENEILKKENEELKIENEKLNKQYIQLNHKIEEEEKNKSEINKGISKLKNDNSILESQIQQLNKVIDELKLKTKNYEEKIKIDIDKKKSDLNFINFYKKTDKKITFLYLVKTRQINSVFDYLDANDIANYRLCCKEVYKILNNEKINTLNKFYLNIIKQKNNIISKINKYDIKTNYLTKLPQLEQLIKIYSLDGKQPGNGLKASIDNALFFLNKNIKGQLGIPESRQRQKTNDSKINNEPVSQENNSEQNTSTYDSFFGGFKNIFSFGSNQQPNNPNLNTNNNHVNQISRSVMQSKYQSKQNSLNVSPIYRSEANSKNASFIIENSKIDFAQSDELLLNEINSNDYGLKSNYEFDYNSPDDINKFLSKFLKSPFPVNKLTEFITRLCNNFSDLLYNSYITIKEVHQLEIVSKSLNERFKYYYDLNNKNEKQLKALYYDKINSNNLYKNNNNRNINNKRDIDEKIIEEGDNLNISEINNLKDENKIDELEKKLDLTQMNLAISNKKSELYEQKYEQVKSHFEQYKEMTKEENNSLKFKIDLLTKENDEMKKKFSDFNNFFNNLLDKDKNKEKKKEID
jgi:hypothetical protein